MPTSHRLACFRDDVVFLIYLYQRWYAHSQVLRLPTKYTTVSNPETLSLLLHRLYPVDKTRVNEYGVSYDEKPKGKTHKD